MVDSLAFNGHFWLPDHPDDKVAGTFQFSPESGGELNLIGSFTSINDLIQGTVRDTERIVAERLNGQYYTLDKCSQTHLGQSQHFYVGTVVETYAYEREEPVEATGLLVSLTNLQRWLGLSGIEAQYTMHETATENDRYQISVGRVPALETRFSNGKLSIDHYFGARQALAESAVTERFQARLLFDGLLPLADAIDYASDLQDLLTIATNRVAGLERVELIHPSFTEEVSPGKPQSKPARLWSHWSALPEPTKHTLIEDDMAFTFKQLGGVNGVGRWMAIAEKYRSQLGRVMNTRYNQHMFQQDIHLGRTAALESFHTKWSNSSKKKLWERLDSLIDLAGAPFERIVPQAMRPAWRKRIVDERNVVAHHSGRSLHFKVAELFYLSESTYWLFVLCMLREAQAPQDCYDHLTKNRHFQRCSLELKAII